MGHKEVAELDSFYVVLDRVIQPASSNFIRADVVQEAASVYEPRLKVNQGLAFQKDDALNFFSYTLMDTVDTARNGVKYRDFVFFKSFLGLSNRKWAEIIGVSEKTMQTIIKEKRDLDKSKSERLLHFIMLVKYGLEIFGDKFLFKQWLEYNAPMLKGKAPIDFLDTIQGVKMLSDLLFKIESGNLI